MATPTQKPNKIQPPSRLGRGLSSLIGAPVSVEPPPAPASGVAALPVGPQVIAVAPPPAPSPLAAPPTPPTPSPSAQATALKVDAPVVETPDADPARRLVYLPLDILGPSPYQPRTRLGEDGLAELARSIRESGVMQPVVVRAAGERRYELIAGERRWRASRLAGLAVIPAVVVTIDDRTAAEWALVENIQREDLNPVDRARAFRALAENFSLTHGQIAERVGLDRASVANAIRLTELEPALLDMLAEGRLTAGHGKALLSAAAGESRVALAHRVADEGWSVRALEEHLRDASAGAPTTAPDARAPGAKPDAPKKERSAQVVALERQLSEHLSTKVRIKARPGSNKGRIEVEFYDLDHFDALMDKLGFSPE